MQDVLSDDEPVPLVGEKRGRDDDDDQLFATGTQTGTQTGIGDENENENENEDGTRTDPEEEEKESDLLLLYLTKLGEVDKTPSRTDTKCCAMDLPLGNVGVRLSSSIF